jgi:hypothetical protein
MKRVIRSVGLAGVLVLSILLSLTQSVHADISHTASSSADYIGHIAFEPIYNLDIKFIKSPDLFDVRVIQDWSSQGTLTIHYTGDASSTASIRFASYAVYIYSNDPWQHVTTMKGSGTSDPKLVSLSFDPQELAFTIPFKIKNLQLHQDYYTPGLNVNWPDITKAAGGWVDNNLNRIKLLVQVNSGDTLGGSCTIPSWDKFTKSGTSWDNSTNRQVTFTENCKWTAHTITQSGGLVKPEWTTIK